TSNSPEAREIWSDLAKTWLRFASDLEANEGLLDQWGKPKPRGTQTVIGPLALNETTERPSFRARAASISAMRRSSSDASRHWRIAARIVASCTRHVANDSRTDYAPFPRHLPWQGCQKI